MMLQLPFIKTHENLYENVNDNMFSFTFLCKFSCILTLLFFVRIFMIFLPKCRTKRSGMIYTILESFCLFLNWERADIWPQIMSRKIPESVKWF